MSVDLEDLLHGEDAQGAHFLIFFGGHQAAPSGEEAPRLASERSIWGLVSAALGGKREFSVGNTPHQERLLKGP